MSSQPLVLMCDNESPRHQRIRALLRGLNIEIHHSKGKMACQEVDAGMTFIDVEALFRQHLYRVAIFDSYLEEYEESLRLEEAARGTGGVVLAERMVRHWREHRRDTDLPTIVLITRWWAELTAVRDAFLEFMRHHGGMTEVVFLDIDNEEGWKKLKSLVVAAVRKPEEIPARRLPENYHVEIVSRPFGGHKLDFRERFILHDKIVLRVFQGDAHIHDKECAAGQNVSIVLQYLARRAPFAFEGKVLCRAINQALGNEGESGRLEPSDLTSVGNMLQGRSLDEITCAAFVRPRDHRVEYRGPGYGLAATVRAGWQE